MDAPSRVRSRLHGSALRERPRAAFRIFRPRPVRRRTRRNANAEASGVIFLQHLENCIEKNFHVPNMKAVCRVIPSHDGCNFKEKQTVSKK